MKKFTKTIKMMSKKRGKKWSYHLAHNANAKSPKIGQSCPKFLQLIWIRSKIRSKMLLKKFQSDLY